MFALLQLLAERQGTVVRKEDLLDEIWGTRFVSESALTSRVRSARQAVGDDGTAQRVIRTVHGRGYELVAPMAPVDDEAPVGPSRLTLTGPGGVGKTALGFELARRVCTGSATTTASWWPTSPRRRPDGQQPVVRCGRTAHGCPL